jgi:hypothetical protein
MKDDFQLFKHHKNYSIYKSERGWLNYYSDGAIESLQMVPGEFDKKTYKFSPSKITIQYKTGEIYQWETLYINSYNMGQFGIAVTTDGKMVFAQTWENGLFCFDAKTGEIAEGLTDATLVAGAFNSVFSWGNIGQKFVAIAMFLFAFTTVLGWSHYGSKAWEYLFGAKTTIIFKIIHVITVIFGAVMTSSLAWDISDTFNGLMMIPNLIGVVVLFPLVMKITQNYVNRKIKNSDEAPVLSYDPEIQSEAQANLENE